MMASRHAVCIILVLQLPSAANGKHIAQVPEVLPLEEALWLAYHTARKPSTICRHLATSTQWDCAIAIWHMQCMWSDS